MSNESNRSDRPGCLPALLQLLRVVPRLPKESRQNVITGEVTKQMIRHLERTTDPGSLLDVIRGLAQRPEIQSSPFALNEVADYLNRRGLLGEALDIFATALILYPTLTATDQRDMLVVKKNYEKVLLAEHERAVGLWRTKFNQAIPIFEHVLESSQQVIQGIPNELGLDQIKSIQTTAHGNLHNTPPGFQRYKPKRKKH